MRFSQRLELVPAAKLAQRESIDDDLKNSLWNLLTIVYWQQMNAAVVEEFTGHHRLAGSALQVLTISIWLHHFKEPIDLMEKHWEPCLEKLRKFFFTAKWFEVYDFIEFIAEHGPSESKQKFIKGVNMFLERENSAYRFVDDRIAEIASAEEINEVEIATEGAADFKGVQTHLKTALALLADRKNPNYRNSIKESISAVESLAKQLAGDEKGTLGAVLDTLEKRKQLHPAMKKAFSSLYGYTSDGDGIRHALLEESHLTQADARFMLICCSAFINFSIAAVERDR